MASLLRQIVAGPRARHPEAGLDLCYVTDNIIATSGPSSTYPQRAYRNPTDALVKFLDSKHGAKWAIWEFRAEGTGYPDTEVYDRIRHYPWPDHHPPPFALIPNIMASMRDWLKGPDSEQGRVVVVHCKAGKGRSGTVACSYLISEEGWVREDALARFTARRMRAGFGEGISIPSQRRWIKYVDWWTKHQKVYMERQIEILEFHVWGLRDGVKVAVEGFVDKGRTIKTFHTFSKDERTLMMDEAPIQQLTHSADDEVVDEEKLPHQNGNIHNHRSFTPSTTASTDIGASAALFRPSSPIVLPTSDVNIDFERRNKAAYGFTMVTSVAHVWFNAFFESQFSSTADTLTDFSSTPFTSPPPASGVFSIAWEAMDGIRGSAKKGTRALDRLSVVWRAVPSPEIGGVESIICEPRAGEPVPESEAADWRKANRDGQNSVAEKDLGLRSESPSQGLSKANSVRSSGSNTPVKEKAEKASGDSGDEGVKAHGPYGEEHIAHPQLNEASDPSPIPTASTTKPAESDASSDTATEGSVFKPAVDLGMEKVKSPAPLQNVGTNRVVNAVDDMRARGLSDDDIKGMEELPEPVEHFPGQVVKEN